MWDFFSKYPDADAASQANPMEIELMIQPIGLSRRRSVALVRMSNDYLLKSWQDKPEVLYGIGKYASDAYRIFCLGQWQDIEPKDGALINYHNFLKEKYSSDRSVM